MSNSNDTHKNKLTTAVYEHRDYVPYGWIAIEYAHINFYGYDADKYEQEWKKIEEEINVPIYKFLKKCRIIETALENYKQKLQEISDKKPFYRFWSTKEEIEIKSKIEKIAVKHNDLENKYFELNNKRKREFRYKIEKFLKKNNFVFVRRNTKGNECCDYTDFYELQN